MSAIVKSFRDMSVAKIATIAGAALFLIAFFIFITFNASTTVMSSLYTNIPLDESGDIIEELEKSNIPYNIGGGGTQIFVPTNMVAKVRATLAQQGLPSNGSMTGYEIFDNSDALGTSNFVLNVNKLRALEGELARTISTFSSIKSTRVHLVIPKKELFSRDKQEPSASIALKMRGKSKLNKNEIQAIRHLVATAVPSLKLTRITIVDNNGRLLARGIEDEDSASAMASTAQEFRVNFENKLKNTIERLIERSLGYGRVKAEINADIDFDRIVTNSETFDPNGQVARSVQGIEETEKSNEKDLKDNVSVGQNLPNAKANNGAILSQRDTTRTDETTNFEISKIVENHIKETGTVNKLSVAVLVDGTYALDENGVSQYTARTKDELAQIAVLVKSAIGFDADRGDTVKIVNMRFADGGEDLFKEGALDWLKDDIDSIIQTLVLGGIALLVVLLIIRPLISHILFTSEDEKEAEAAEQALLSGADNIAGRLAHLSDDEDNEAMISISRIDGGVKSSTYKKINEMIESHPEETLTVLRNWAFSEKN